MNVVIHYESMNVIVVIGNDLRHHTFSDKMRQLVNATYLSQFAVSLPYFMLKKCLCL